jgi:hypothetical protein
MNINGFDTAILVIACVIFGFFWGGHVYGTQIMEQAIDRGYASFCPNTGDFAWVGECNLNTGHGE